MSIKIEGQGAGDFSASDAGKKLRLDFEERVARLRKDLQIKSLTSSDPAVSRIAGELKISVELFEALTEARKDRSDG